MFSLRTLLADGLAFGAICFVSALGALSIAMVVYQWRTLSRELLASAALWPTRLKDWRSKASIPEDRFFAALESSFAFRSADGARIVTSTDPRESLQEEVGHRIRSGFASIGRPIGENLTAIALVLTFVLLGVVLVGPIVAALGAGGNAAEAQLKDAVGKMGAKFFVSATGLLLALFFQLIARWTQERLSQKISDSLAECGPLFESLEAAHARAADATVAELRTMRQELGVVEAKWTPFVSKLDSMSVSITGIGEEVATHAATLIKDEVVKRICESVADLQKRAEELADAVQSQLTKSFAESLRSEMGRLESGIGGVKAAVEGQAQADIERLMEKLADSVSGGFRSQSDDMGKQLARFTEVLPQLQFQFSQLAESLNANAQSWGEQNQRAMEALTSRIGDLLGQFEAAKTGMHGAVEQIAVVSRSVADDVSGAAGQQIQALAQALAGSARAWGEQNNAALIQMSERVTDLIERFDGVRSSFEAGAIQAEKASSDAAVNMAKQAEGHASAVSQQVAALKRTAEEGADALEKRASTFAASVADAQKQIVDSSRSMNETISQMALAMKAAAAIQERAQASVLQFGESAKQVAESAKRLEGTVGKQIAFVDREEQLLAAQRAAVDALEPVFGTLMKTYEQGIQRQTKELASEWEKLAQKTQSILSSVSTDFAESVEDLNGTVKELKDVMKVGTRGVR